MKIAVDAGHGGQAPGAVWYGIKEKDVNLEIARKLAAALDGAYLIRSSDVMMSHADRGKKAAGAELVLSVHCNANQNTWVSGTELYDRGDCPVLLRRMKTALEDGGRTPVRLFAVQSTGWLARANTVVSAFAAPCVLIEAGYLSNIAEKRKLLEPLWQDHFVKLLVEGVEEWITMG